MNNQTSQEMEVIPATITKEELNTLDNEILPLSPILLNSNSKSKDIERACQRLRETDVIGFDTETKPSFKKGQHFPVALLQLSNDQIVVLVQLTSVEDFSLTKWSPLRRLLASPYMLKVGVGIHDDGLGLAKDHGLITNRTLDLRSLAGAAGIEVLSLSKIYALIFGKKLSKGQRLSDWSKLALTEAQIAYAALDAYAGYRIYEALKEYAKPQMIQKKLYSQKRSKKEE